MSTIAGTEIPFRPWRPEDGAVFTTPYAFDCETTRIDEARPWLTPAYVLGAACDGRQGYFVPREHVAAFLAAHAGVPVVMHHAPFDLAVIHSWPPSWTSTAGSTPIGSGTPSSSTGSSPWPARGTPRRGKGQSTLEHCAETYLDIDLPKDVVDSRGNPVRLSYGQWLNRPPREIEPVYLEYLARDAVVTFAPLRDAPRRIKALPGGQRQDLGLRVARSGWPSRSGAGAG